MLVPYHDTMPSFMIFSRVLDLPELKTKFLNISDGATMPRCLNFIPISYMGPRNSPKDTHVIHWYASVLYKQFLTPFRDGIWDRRQVSVGDRGSFPQDPETVGDMEQ